MAEPLRLLVVDDAPEHARMVEEFIRASDAWANASIRIATSYDQALRRLRGTRPSTLRFSITCSARATA